MSLFKRIATVFQSEAHSAVDKLEDPVKMTEQGIRDLKKDLHTAMEALAETKALAVKLKKDRDTARSRAEKFAGDARRLLQQAQAGKLEEAKAFYLTDFTGLNVQKMTALRAKMRAEGVEYLVVKNTLALRALEGLDVPDIAEFFTGPTGLVIGREDAVTAAKVLKDFAKENDDRPAVKVGVVERQSVGPEEVGRLADLPPREVLLAQLAGAMQAPLATLVLLMEGKAREFVGLLEALRTQRESE